MPASHFTTRSRTCLYVSLHFQHAQKRKAPTPRPPTSAAQRAGSHGGPAQEVTNSSRTGIVCVVASMSGQQSIEAAVALHFTAGPRTPKQCIQGPELQTLGLACCWCKSPCTSSTLLGIRLKLKPAQRYSVMSMTQHVSANMLRLRAFVS